jgi:ABC-type sulfate/molybdate transport systems ATPase subunit
MNLRYENIRFFGTKDTTQQMLLSMGHGQLDHGQITVLTGPDRAAQRAFLEIIAGVTKPSEGRLTYGIMAEDGRWRYHPEVPFDQLLFVRSKPGLLKRLLLDPQKRAQEFLMLLKKALADQPDLLLVDEPEVAFDDKTCSAIDELLLQAHRDNALTIVLICNDSLRISKLNAKTLTFANGSVVDNSAVDGSVDNGSVV